MKHGTFSLAALMILITSCGGPSAEQTALMAKESANKAAFEKLMSAWDSGDRTIMSEMLADNFVTHNPDPEISSTGKQHWLDQLEMYHASNPDMKGEVKVILADGDWVAAAAMVKGTNTGAMGPMPATGKAWECTGIDMVRFENGKAVEHWGLFDVMAMMNQLGLMGEHDHEMAMEKEHVCTAACKNGEHVYAHGEKGHVCTEECKKMMEKKG